MAVNAITAMSKYTTFDYWYQRIRLIFIAILIVVAGNLFSWFAHRDNNLPPPSKEPSEWTSKNKAILMEQMMNRADLQQINPVPRAAFCNCLIGQLQSKYPNGFDKTPDTTELNEMNQFCLDSITFGSVISKSHTEIFKK